MLVPTGILQRRRIRGMDIRAHLSNTESQHRVVVETDGRSQALAIMPKSAGRGSSINGGELLLAALATCFCNDLYREAARRQVAISRVDVTASATFGGPGEPGKNISYRVDVEGDAPPAVLEELVRATDAVTEIQNTLRAGCAVQLLDDTTT